MWRLFKPKFIGEGREREKIEIMVPFRPYAARNRKFKNNCKKIQKIKKFHYGFFSIQNTLENRSYPPDP